jgi:hypothetical protein
MLSVVRFGAGGRLLGRKFHKSKLRPRALFFGLVLVLAPLLPANSGSAVAQEIPHIGNANLNGIRAQLTRIDSIKYACRRDAKAAIDWLEWELRYVGNILLPPSLAKMGEELENDLRSEIAKLQALPPCKTHVQTDYDKRLRDRFRTGTRPEREPVEERVEIGSSGKTWTGGYIGGELAENWGRVRSTETLAATGAITNQFTDSGDPIGGGLVAGYNFRPWNNNIILGPFASFDWLNQAINHNGAGFLLGTTTHWFATVGAKGGYVVSPGVYLYGLAGASWLNQSLNVNFATAASTNATTPGFTLGLGGEYQPSSWRLFGNPVSVFMQYQHTWWGTANFNTPSSSTLSNYAFKREDNTLKLGVNIHLSR